MKHPGEVIRMWRNERKISIPKLASKSKVDKGTISRFERGGDYRQKTFYDLLKALNEEPQKVYAVLASGYEQTLTPAAAFSRPDLHEMLDKIVASKNNGLIYGIEVNLRSLSASATGADYLPPDEPLEGGGLPITIDPRTDKPLRRKGGR
jgi:transcriptional regulator with XRE-family HTH domain